MRDSRLQGGAENPCSSNRIRNVRSLRIVHGLGWAAVHTIDDVGVGIEGDLYAGVSEQLLDELGVLACHEEYCSAGVADVVELTLSSRFRLAPSIPGPARLT
jgi:hypothetical protein